MIKGTKNKLENACKYNAKIMSSYICYLFNIGTEFIKTNTNVT